MSKSIQESLDLPVLEDLLKASRLDTDQLSAESITEQEDADIDNAVSDMASTLAMGATTEEIAEARDRNDHAKSMDELHDETIQHARDLMDLGYNIDTRSAGRIFENAAAMFKLALDAKNSKRDAQLKHSKLQVDRRKVAIMEKAVKGTNGDDTINGESVVVEDRNELIKRLRAESNK